MNPTEGTILSGRYCLTQRIAAGGMGEVWAASDTVLGRTVAVKLLSPALSQQSGFLERFRAEARHSAALHHPNITTVFDYGEDDGSAYLVMELVAGQPLSQIISERAPLSAQVTTSILIQAATALEAAHQGGVVHRDVKPANILITPDGTAKLTDFGISRLVHTAPLTQTGEVLGTAQYLAPEQVSGQSATPASDIYALGVVGHEMLTGQRPFDADTMIATALAHLNQPTPQLPDTVPVGIRTVISAALAKDPADRPATAAVMADALGRPDADFASGVPGAGALTLPALGLAAAALTAPALPALTQAMPAQTLSMSTRAMTAGPAGTHDRRSRVRPAWLLAVVGAGAALVAFAAFATPGNSTPTPVATAPTTSSPSPNNSNATESTGTTTEVATPSGDSSMPGPLNRANGKARGHNNAKDGKP
jgi:eukaryotic-like serine/threonine-protein kinase